ncbi:MAG: HEAT repeat domain-containing protein [Verrucomicrobiae bacterium]|nr:HEAT repeat domain-containing protein [Verrucomicrobiae bacterium]
MSARTVNAEHADKAVRAPLRWRRWRFVLPVAMLLASYDVAIPAGKQLTGVYAPAPTPALAPAEAEKKFVLHEGFEARIFAAEPDVVNPVAMTWDERGRLWVLELHEYPMGAKPGEKPRDRIKILEDTNNDGRADKVTVFADGLNLATGLLLGNGGVYVGQAPHLLFLQDTNHDDRVDRREILLTGFGLEDRHELLNGFTWGPDGWLYMTHGVFTHSKVKIPEATEPGVIMNAAVARFHPRTKKFEVFAEGTSNPWGVDFDRYGNAFVSACVIDHLFHIAPGGSYQRQAGAPSNPYTYELLPSIVDHKHHMAAYCGICIYQGDQFPEEYRGRVFMGNIHQNAINHDRLIPNGSSFKAVAEKDFLTTSDGWFRPVSQQVGPDGALWIADWYDKYPCYQNAMADPEGVDREHGRIWRVVYVGKEAGKTIPPRPEVKMDFSKLGGTNLVELFNHPNVWQRRMAQRILQQRLSARRGRGGPTEPGVHPALLNTLDGKKSLEASLAAFWTMQAYGSGVPRWIYWSESVVVPEMWLRKWMAAWHIIALEDYSAEAISTLEKLAADADPRVRLAVATAVRRFVAGALTVNDGVYTEAPVGGVLAALIKSSADAKDPLLPYMIWHASEPLLAHNPQPGLDWLAENGPATLPLSGILTRKAMRRICDTRDAAKLNLAMDFLARIADSSAELTTAALDGLLEGQKGQAFLPTVDSSALLNKLAASANSTIVERTRQLGALWGEAGAIQQMFAMVNDRNAGLNERAKAIQTLAKLKSPAARDAALKLVTPQNPDTLVIEALRALSEIGGDTVGQDLIERWKTFSPGVRQVAGETLTSRSRWAGNLLSAVERQVISASELSATTIRALASFVRADDEGLRRRFEQSIGRVRSTDADKQKIIEARKQMILSGGEPDLQAGRELTKQHCLVCHKLNGEGADVGPDLTGSGRSTLDALLANVIDPNQVIGKGFENVEIETQDGRIVSGRLVEDSAAHVKLLASGPKEEIVARSEIAQMRVSELSVMPEGLEQMPDEDFRNMILFLLNPPVEK